MQPIPRWNYQNNLFSCELQHQCTIGVITITELGSISFADGAMAERKHDYLQPANCSKYKVLIYGVWVRLASSPGHSLGGEWPRDEARVRSDLVYLRYDGWTDAVAKLLQWHSRMKCFSACSCLQHTDPYIWSSNCSRLQNHSQAPYLEQFLNHNQLQVKLTTPCVSAV